MYLSASHARHKLAIVILFLAVMLFIVNIQALNKEQEVPAIVSGLVDSLVFTNPVILDIRCGEWTPAMELELRKKLLSQQVDVREISFGMIKDSNEYLPMAMESDFGVNGAMLLQMLKLPQADYLELTLVQSVETGEKRNVFSYARYSAPVYRFELKQISLPEQRLVVLRDYKLTGSPEIENPGSLIAMKWYEPIIASAILGSLVLMLWTLK